jgi:arsenate reductase-like glutaredoxin family protein
MSFLVRNNGRMWMKSTFYCATPSVTMIRSFGWFGADVTAADPCTRHDKFLYKNLTVLNRSHEAQLSPPPPGFVTTIQDVMHRKPVVGYGRRYSTTIAIAPPIVTSVLSKQRILNNVWTNLSVPTGNASFRESRSSGIACKFSTTAETMTTGKSSDKPIIPLHVQLYQYTICPFCNRVKTVMEYIGSDTISMQNIEVNPLTKSEIRPWKKVYTKVPIATIQASSDSNYDSNNHENNTHQEETIFGSDAIIQKILNDPIVRTKLQEKWQSPPQVGFSSNPMTWDEFAATSTSSSEWIQFATNELAVWLYPNMCRSWKDSYIAFGYVHDPHLTFSAIQRFLIQNIGSLVRPTCKKRSILLFFHCINDFQIFFIF